MINQSSKNILVFKGIGLEGEAYSQPSALSANKENNIGSLFWQ